MSKIHELIEKIACYGVDYDNNETYSAHHIELILKEYAEWYLEQFKESCKEQFYIDDFGCSLLNEQHFDSTPNPPHE